MATEEREPDEREPDHTEDPRKQETGQGYPEENPAGDRGDDAAPPSPEDEKDTNES